MVVLKIAIAKRVFRLGENLVRIVSSPAQAKQGRARLDARHSFPVSLIKVKALPRRPGRFSAVPAAEEGISVNMHWTLSKR